MSHIEEIHDREVVQLRRTMIYALILGIASILTILSIILAYGGFS